jgi:anion-transporting  ArsA/GET3 family ATPase
MLDPWDSLQSMPATRLIFVSGKGGTGKSAVSAATSIEFARRGHRVLAIDMLGQTGLAAHLRSTGLGYDPREVRPGLFAMAMNRSNALDEYLKTQLHIPQGAPTKQISAALAVLADTAPGVREIISIGKPVAEARTGQWDVVVVDAPSLGQFQSYLAAPRIIAELVPTGNVRRLASGLESRLLDEEVTSIQLVTTPAELPTLETEEAIATIQLENLAPEPKVVFNRVLEDSGISIADLEKLGDGPLRDASTLQLDLEVEQVRWLGELEHSGTLPYLFGVFTPGEVAEQLADRIDPSL